MNKLKELWTMIHRLKSLHGPMIVAIFLGLLGHLSALMIPVLGVVLITQPFHPVYLVLLIGSGVFRGVYRYGEQLMNHYIAFHVLADIRVSVFEKLRELAPAKLEGKDQGDIIALATGDIELIEVFYAHTLSPLVIAFLFNSLVIIALAMIDFKIGLVSLVTHLLLSVFIPMYFGNLNKNLGLKYRNHLGQFNSLLLEGIHNYQGFRQFSGLEARKEKLNTLSIANTKIQERVKQSYGISMVLTDLIIYLSLIVVLVLGFQQSRAFAMVILVIHISSFGPSLALGNLSLDLNQTIGSIMRINDLLQEDPMIYDNTDGVCLDYKDLNVSDVTFSYEETRVLDEISLKVEQGQIIGIMGESGSGKSTLAKLLMRFWDVDDGFIAMNDINIKEIETQSLRKNQRYMTQSTNLFTGTIFENITMFQDGFTQEMVENAAHQAAVHDFIEGLEYGYQTKIEEMGENVSSGEKQRLALARMFLSKSPLLILDEPTSNLDSLSEAMILKSLHENKDGRSIVIISHRQSTMRIADCVYKMENGNLNELQDL
ncbi:ABC transporter ATP-binding protein [Erysipelothrix urinaevulpis]|uniref:ABC transporter ATP-binding protein n=1 Tax=Erysipelothrix urinaevulpis TaxID=2683717 RepID=UPI0013586416|nr:ABC transporter ATP-binding protein [Erysipelothrix urinaevulpis]